MRGFFLPEISQITEIGQKWRLKSNIKKTSPQGTQDFTLLTAPMVRAVND